MALSHVQRRKALRLCREGYATQTIARAMQAPHWEIVAYLRDRSAGYWSRVGDGWTKQEIEEPTERQLGDPTPEEIAAMTAAIRMSRQQPEVAAACQDDLESARTEWRRLLAHGGISSARHKPGKKSGRLRRRSGE